MPSETQDLSTLPKEMADLVRIICLADAVSWRIKHLPKGRMRIKVFLEDGSVISIRKEVFNEQPTLDRGADHVFNIISARRRKVLSLRMEGRTQTEIATIIGYSQSTVSSDCAELGID